MSMMKKTVVIERRESLVTVGEKFRIGANVWQCTNVVHDPIHRHVIFLRRLDGAGNVLKFGKSKMYIQKLFAIALKTKELIKIGP